jgi:hypothetical protein
VPDEVPVDDPAGWRGIGQPVEARGKSRAFSFSWRGGSFVLISSRIWQQETWLPANYCLLLEPATTGSLSMALDIRLSLDFR